MSGAATTPNSPVFDRMMAEIKAEAVAEPWPEAGQAAYAEKHGKSAVQFTAFPEESDIQIAGRARMLMRDSWSHEAVCTATRDRICRLWLEKRALAAALVAAGVDPAAVIAEALS